MHSKSLVVNLAERHETLLVNKLVLVIGGGSPMNESDHLMTSLPPGTSGLTAN